MEFIVSSVLIDFTISSFRVHQVVFLWLHRQEWVSSNSPDFSLLDYHVWSNAGVLSHLQPEPKTVPEFIRCTAGGLVCYSRRWQATVRCKTSASDCRHVCQPTV